ncbi:nucleotidyltransferase domain-containing protein [Clostridium sp. 19966]|uniref:nucleotidyltransferase domain-containing protein n=1 Tax=Clostridium sp. 19966 TaxID=2768166 RepID=UPI0028DD884E|nr:nucleotidyltransferase domain-containing protein [Clostridium sp. 19966]MDT8717459.1 nucleotidyltransferase domain-containing protein [Clostridium sp. 19966]
MNKPIIKYQKSFNAVVERLKKNEEVLAAMVFGSMVSGDLWEESDIDFFVITRDEPDSIKNIYTTEKTVPIHIKIMSKNKFLQLHESDLRGGFIHRIFASSRLIFSKDDEVTNRYNNGRYYPDLDRERWNVVYLGKLLKNISLCKKYIYSDRIATAYSIVMSCAEDYGRMYLNFSGHMISRDIMNMTMNLNDNFKTCINKLIFNKDNLKESINYAIEFFDMEIDSKIKEISSLLIEYMKKKDIMLSAEDIKNDILFENYDIDVEYILNELWKRNIIKKSSREFKLSSSKIISMENVYYI